MTGLFENTRARPVLDTATGKIYRSRNQAGVAVAAEFGVDPTKRPSPWFDVIRKCPKGRFVDANSGLRIDQDGRVEPGSS